ncbi:AMIN domain-containing protein, partial [bacterium]|nr:AMIN domain-containing protein [bacterium]
MKKMVWFCVIGMVCGIFIKSTVQGTDEEKEVSYRQLTSVRMETVSDDKTKLIISLNGRIKYHCFKITKPLRLVIELTNTLHNWEQKEIEDTGDSLIKRVRSAQFQNEPIKISRVVLDLKDKVSYKSELDDITNQLVVTLTREAKKTAKKKIAKISPKKKKIKERTTKKTAKKEEGVFPSISKQIVSLDFNEAEIRDVLRILAVKSGVNIVYGDDVSGTVTIHLDDVPFDDAVSMILKIRGLVIQKVSGNIFRVIT